MDIMTRTLIVSTCGTSILTNQSNTDLRALLTQTTNHKEEALPSEQQTAIDHRVEEQKVRLLGESLSNVRSLSAELNGVIGFYDGQLDRGRSDRHILIHTDTYQGAAAADVIREWMQTKGLTATCERVPELSTASLEAFQMGMNHLVSWCDNTVPGYRKSGFHVAFNLVGGFKSIQGFMQTLGMFYSDEILYIFESGNQLLRIPRLPIEIDRAAQEAIRSNLIIIRKLDLGCHAIQAGECDSVPETFLYKFGDQVDLSPWGRLVWKKHKPTIYGEALLDSLSNRLRFSDAVVQAVRRLPPERIEMFNERMDDLARYIDGGLQNCPKRLDFKQLKGNPCPPSTHECDLWADADTQRAFGRFDGPVLIVDRIGPALHKG